MEIDRRHFIASLGGAAVVKLMSHEARAEALEAYMSQQVDAAGRITSEIPTSTLKKFPTVAELDAQIETRHFRRGIGGLFATTDPTSKVKRLPPMPAKPTFLDFFNLRFGSSHVLQSANRAMKTGMSEEIILACLLHDTAMSLMKVDHGYWAAQLYEPYVPPKTAFAIRYHQALRFFEDKEAGYVYPDAYRVMFGEDYVPAPHIQADYKMVRDHKWYMEPRSVTVNDLYSFDPKSVVKVEQFTDIVGRHFKQPKEGLGNDNSPVAHMWRSIAMPDNPL